MPLGNFQIFFFLISITVGFYTEKKAHDAVYDTITGLFLLCFVLFNIYIYIYIYIYINPFTFILPLWLYLKKA